jgi:hypothetical protein
MKGWYIIVLLTVMVGYEMLHPQPIVVLPSQVFFVVENDTINITDTIVEDNKYHFWNHFTIKRDCKIRY